MSAKLKQLKERKAEAVKQLRAAHDALSAAPGDEAKKKDFDERSNAIALLNAEIEREERVSALEAAAPDTRTAPGATNPGDNPLEHAQRSEPDNPVLNPDRFGYSLLRAIRIRCGDEPMNGVEAEVHQELAKRHGKSPQGILVPHTLRMGMTPEQRTIVTTSTAAGAIPTILAPTLIDALRNRVVLRQLGCTILSDMVGAFAIPRKTATTGFEWVAEGTAATQTTINVGTLAFALRTLTGGTRITRSFMKQTSLDAENMVRQDLTDGLAVGLDNGGINGTGSNNQPFGLLNLAGISTTAGGTNGAALTWANVVAQETAVSNVNADVATMAYLTNSRVRGAAKTVPKVAGQAIFIMENGEMNGYPVGVSNLMPSNLVKGSSGSVCSAMLFGNFADAIFALWGGMDVIADPYTESTQGNVRLTCFQSADFNVRRVESFNKNVDILA